MTQNQIAYMQAQETERRNKAVEDLEQQKRDIERYSAEAQAEKLESDILVNDIKRYQLEQEGAARELTNILDRAYYTGSTAELREFLQYRPGNKSEQDLFEALVGDERRRDNLSMFADSLWALVGLDNGGGDAGGLAKLIGTISSMLA